MNFPNKAYLDIFNTRARPEKKEEEATTTTI